MFLAKRNIENVEKVMSSVMASGAHGHMFCSDLVFFHWNTSLRPQAKMVEYVEADPEGLKEMFCASLERMSRSHRHEKPRVVQS